MNTKTEARLLQQFSDLLKDSHRDASVYAFNQARLNIAKD